MRTESRTIPPYPESKQWLETLENLELSERRAYVDDELSEPLNLSRRYLVRAELRNVKAFRVNLRDADLRHANLEGAQLHHADLSGADLRNAKLRNVDMQGARLKGADLSGADLTRARLDGADLSPPEGGGEARKPTRLVGAELIEATLRAADLTGADLADADISGAQLVATRLCGVALEAARSYAHARFLEGLATAGVSEDPGPPELVRPQLCRANEPQPRYGATPILESLGFKRFEQLEREVMARIVHPRTLAAVLGKLEPLRPSEPEPPSLNATVSAQ